jgi:long-subunit fatty acid transport protein
MLRVAKRAGYLLSLAAVPPTLAGAQDFFHGGLSPETAAHSGIYAPNADRVSDALALNPAGLTALAAPTAEGVAFGGLATGSFSDATNVNSAMRLRPGVVPFGGIGGPFGHSRWSGGLGFTPDFLSSVHWHYADAPGTAGAAYGSQPETSQILVFRASAGLGYVISPRVSAGGTVGLIYNENTLVAPFIFQTNPQLKGLKTLLALHTRGFGWGGSAGLTARATQKVELHAAYSSPYTVNGTGHASGNLGVQFAAAGIPFAPGYIYRAKVRVKLPQSVLAGSRWQVSPRLALALQGDWINFRCAFDSLPIRLNNGNNADINNFLGSSSIADEVPLKWSDQFLARFAADYLLTPKVWLAGGFTRRSSLVPDGTVTPLTGAIMKNAASAGAGYRRKAIELGAAYSYNFNQTARVGTSGLLSGEYDDSRLTVGTQALVLGASVRFR